jgi:hypothetical protein
MAAAGKSKLWRGGGVGVILYGKVGLNVRCKDSRHHLSPNFVSIRVWLAYDFGSKFGDKIPLVFILFDPFWFDAWVRVRGGHTLCAVPWPERALRDVARSQSEVWWRWHGLREAVGSGWPSLLDRVRGGHPV